MEPSRRNFRDRGKGKFVVWKRILRTFFVILILTVAGGVCFWLLDPNALGNYAAQSRVTQGNRMRVGQVNHGRHGKHGGKGYVYGTNSRASGDISQQQLARDARAGYPLKSWVKLPYRLNPVCGWVCTSLFFKEPVLPLLRMGLEQRLPMKKWDKEIMLCRLTIWRTTQRTSHRYKTS